MLRVAAACSLVKVYGDSCWGSWIWLRVSISLPVQVLSFEESPSMKFVISISTSAKLYWLCVVLSGSEILSPLSMQDDDIESCGMAHWTCPTSPLPRAPTILRDALLVAGICIDGSWVCSTDLPFLYCRIRSVSTRSVKLIKSVPDPSQTSSSNSALWSNLSICKQR